MVYLVGGGYQKSNRLGDSEAYRSGKGSVGETRETTYSFQGPQIRAAITVYWAN
jgi:hypothetical protein